MKFWVFLTRKFSVLLDIERENIAEMGELVEKLLERERSKTFCSLF